MVYANFVVLLATGGETVASWLILCLRVETSYETEVFRIKGLALLCL